MTMWILAILFLFLSACVFGPGNFQSSQSTDLESRKIKRFAILPATGFSPKGKNSQSDPAWIFTRQLYSTMSALPNWQIVSDREVNEVAAQLGQGADGTRAKKLGELVYADAVLSGRLLRYREREGEELGVKNPASVAFILELWDARRGDIIWSARFDETQKPLTENIFAIGEFARRGARWLSAEELMLEGVKKSVQQLDKVLYGA
jgi:hypothetical protein